MRLIIAVVICYVCNAQHVTIKLEYANRLINDAIELKYYKALSQRCDSLVSQYSRAFYISNSIVTNVELKSDYCSKSIQAYQIELSKAKRRERILKFIAAGTGVLAIIF